MHSRFFDMLRRFLLLVTTNQRPVVKMHASFAFVRPKLMHVNCAFPQQHQTGLETLGPSQTLCLGSMLKCTYMTGQQVYGKSYIKYVQHWIRSGGIL